MQALEVAILDEVNFQNESEFSKTEIENLVQGVTEQSMNELIDWEKISSEDLQGKRSAIECLYAFLKLPIGEQLSTDLNSNEQQKVGEFDQSRPFVD